MLQQPSTSPIELIQNAQPFIALLMDTIGKILSVSVEVPECPANHKNAAVQIGLSLTCQGHQHWGESGHYTNGML